MMATKLLLYGSTINILKVSSYNTLGRECSNPTLDEAAQPIGCYCFQKYSSICTLYINNAIEYSTINSFGFLLAVKQLNELDNQNELSIYIHSEHHDWSIYFPAK